MDRVEIVKLLNELQEVILHIREQLDFGYYDNWPQTATKELLANPIGQAIRLLKTRIG